MVLLSMTLQAFSFDPFTQEIPADANEARLLLETDEIDSVLWLSLEPLYRHPVQVPDGELVLLHNIFPELGIHLPVQSEVLNRYLPWNDDAITRFLEDYPIVNHFKPIIQFACRERGRRGDLGYCMRVTDTHGASVNFIRSSLQVNRIRMSSSLKVTEEYTRWERKSVTLNPIPQCKIIAGNQTLFHDKGLVFGFFPSDNLNERDRRFNWLYSEASTWNGIGIDWSSGPLIRGAPSCSFFHHHRPTERISGGTITLNPSNHVIGCIGITATETDSATFPQLHLHGSFMIATPRWRSEITCVSNGRSRNGFPLTMTHRFTQDEHQFHVTLTHFPSGFSAPYSALLHRFHDAMTIPDTCSPAITFVRVMSKKVSGGKEPLWPQATIWFLGNAIHHGEVVLNGEKCYSAIDVFIKSGFEFVRDPQLNRYKIECEIVWSVSQMVAIQATHYVCYSPYTKTRYYAALCPSLHAVAGLEVKPFVKICFHHGSLYSITGGYRQRVTLNKKIWTELSAEKIYRYYNEAPLYRVTANALFQF